jgi:hypothetical protein
MFLQWLHGHVALSVHLRDEQPILTALQQTIPAPGVPFEPGDHASAGGTMSVGKRQG